MRRRIDSTVQDEQLIELAYHAAVETKGWATLAEALERSLGGNAVVLSLPHPQPGDRGVLVAPSLDRRFVESYGGRFFAADPFRRPGDPLSAGRLALRAGGEHGAQVVERPFFRDWLQPQGLEGDAFLGGMIECDDEVGAALLGVYRRRGAGPLGAAEQRLCERLMPHLQRAVRIHFRKMRLEEERRALSAAFDHVPLGLLLLDGKGRIRLANGAARQLLKERDPLTLDRDGLRAARPEDTKRLRELLEQAREPEAKGPTGLLLHRLGDHRPLEAAVLPLRTQKAVPAGEAHLAALFVSDPAEAVATPPELLRRFYDLTPSEAALAQELARGRSLGEAAEQLHVTRGTVRQRLSRVFAKTDTGRQAELVGLLLRGLANLRWEHPPDVCPPPRRAACNATR